MSSAKTDRRSDFNLLPDKEFLMKSIYTLVFVLLMGCANADATEPNKAPMTFGLEPVTQCVDGQCAMPTANYGMGRTVNWSPQTVSYKAVQVPTTTMVEQTVDVPVQKTITVMEQRTVQVPVTTYETQCQATCQQSLPTSVTRTRRVWFPRHRARVEQRRAKRTNGC